MRKASSTTLQTDHFKGLFSLRLNVLAHRMSQLAALVNQQQFELGVHQWRIIGLLGNNTPMSLQTLASAVGIDKSQTSRIVSGLVERRLLLRKPHHEDGRSIRISLSSQGQNVHNKAFPEAIARNEELLSALTERERLVLESALDKLSHQATRMLVHQRQSAVPPPVVG